MKLQTEIPLEKAKNQIGYDGQLLLLGSCFVENMGVKFDYFKFRQVQNPFGILFHALAIGNLIERAVLRKSYTEADVFHLNERWHCFDAHSALSNTSKENLLEKLNESLEETFLRLETASHIIITLGTAWAYRHKHPEISLRIAIKRHNGNLTKNYFPYMISQTVCKEQCSMYVRSTKKYNLFSPSRPFAI